ncbi:MAG: peptidoglycan DD-metalloendopeptidase family protein [Bacteroidales bacterium]
MVLMIKPIHHVFSNGAPTLGLLLIMALMSTQLAAQTPSREALERDKQKIEQEIRLINQMLQETKKTAEVNVGQLVMLNNQIKSRENLVSTLNNEINTINRRIKSYTQSIQELEQELEALREAYVGMLKYAQLNRNAHQRMMFLFSSRDFHQAFQRMKYLKQLARHRQIQGEKIIETQQSLKEQIEALDKQKAEQQVLLAEHRAAVQSLSREKNDQNRAVSQLRQKEKELSQRLQQQQKTAGELQKAIEEVIAQEIRKAREAADAAGRTAPDMFALTPEELLLSNNFSGNKGKLPWPLERGIITGHFGEQPHPVLPGIKISNNGIDISTTQGARARAVFEGTVTRVITIPGAYFAVIVRHGEYLSVYSHLSDVLVRSGDTVSVRQELGVVATDSRDAKTHLNLQIWHGNSKLNPAEWITRQR